MELKLTFNTDPDSYDKFRSTYDQALFNDLIEYSKLDSSKKVLEIGIGTGQATQYILETGCQVTAIEIGDELAEFTRKKYKDYDNLDIITCDFESVELLENSYDLIYSASAFHWIPLNEGMTKVKKLLKSDGVFAWISTSPIPDDSYEATFKDIQKVYGQYPQYFNKDMGDGSLKYLIQMTERKLDNRGGIFKEYGFNNIEKKLYTGERIFTHETYPLMTSTFSDHKVMKYEDRIAFQESLKNVIKDHGGLFKLKDRFLLCMGTKNG